METAGKEGIPLNTQFVKSLEPYHQNRKACVETYQQLAAKFSDAAVNPSFSAKERMDYANLAFRASNSACRFTQADAALLIFFLFALADFAKNIKPLASHARRLCA